ncbi:hypothetical protein [uncultured Cocleimonas sp.]|uniref:hypothetical protein n=1 Tax=uncultured Cocleimonas sp. TaxID=1051587 RepID=UPI002639BDCC|nr:hypothetical protein [uncultured Cocleimonas sp.]
MRTNNHFFRKLQFLTLMLILFTGINTAEAAACTNNNWKPTFVHDLNNPDGPWYAVNGQFIKVRIKDNWDWRPHACRLINQYGIRDRAGYTNCQEYTRIQCGCKRGLSERNSTCASFLSWHNKKSPTLAYLTNNNGIKPFPAPNVPFNPEGMVPFPTPENSYIHCPKRNPGQKSWYKYPANNKETYLTCSYFKDGGLRSEIPYVNRKKQGIELLYKSEKYHRLGYRTMHRNGKKHGAREQWAIDRKTGKHFMQFKTRFDNNKKVGIHCKYKPNGSTEFWTDSNHKNRCFSSQSSYCEDRCRNY